MIKLPKQAHVKYTTKVRSGFLLDGEPEQKRHTRGMYLHTWDREGRYCTDAIRSSISNYHSLERVLDLYSVSPVDDYYSFTEEDLKTYIDISSGNTLDNVVELGDTYIRKYEEGYKILYGLGTMIPLDEVKVRRRVGELVYCSLGESLICTRLLEGNCIDNIIPNSMGLPITLEDLEEEL